jgi:hypothetical protein
VFSFLSLHNDCLGMSLFHTLRHLFHPQRSNNHRPKILHPDGLFAVVFIVGAAWLAISPMGSLSKRMGHVLGFASNITANEVVLATNQERAKEGLGQLTTNAKLNQAALAKAQNMFSQQYWAHIAPDGTEPWKFFRDANYKYSVAGENLARDFSNTNDMMTAWLASPTHKKNIMDNRYQEIGVAVVDGNLLGTDTTLVVQLFGTPMTGQPEIDQSGKKVVAKPAPVKEVTFVESATDQNLQHTEANGANVPTQPMTRQEVLASTVVPASDLHTPIFLSPLQMSKIFFLIVIMVISLTLIYDSFIMNNHNTVRLVGKNFAHLALLLVTGFLLLLFKGGVIG